jgi:Leucine-rich repeat (LRR) protein
VNQAKEIKTGIHCAYFVLRLSSLQHLSIDDNELEELPFEMCALRSLAELHCANNKLNLLPLEFGYLINLERLHIQKNKLKELPEVGQLY